MSKLYTVMDSMAKKIEATGVAKSTAIGIEANISGDDYPLVRIVPTKVSKLAGTSPRNASILVYFGGKLFNHEGLPQVYELLCSMEEVIVKAVEAGSGWKAVHVETLFDEDRLPAYKMACARFDVIVTSAAKG